MIFKRFFLTLNFIGFLMIQNSAMASCGESQDIDFKMNYFSSKIPVGIMLEIISLCPLESLNNIKKTSRENRDFIYNFPEVYKPYIKIFSKIYDKENNLFDFSQVSGNQFKEIYLVTLFLKEGLSIYHSVL